jgi:photosynthetic reaction center cytochrome c subunit
MTRMFPGAARLFATGACLLAATGCELGKKESAQLGYRGTGMELIVDKTDIDRNMRLVAAGIPPALPPAGAPTAGPSPWRNVQVLTDVSPAEFTRTMLAMSTWVAGTGNCAYCHNLADMAADTNAGGTPIYTKLTARRMLRMVRDVNGNYEAHVKNTGVTCYTCHLGQPVPKSTWVFDGNPNQVERYFLDRNAVRVQSTQVAASNANRSSVKQTEYTYAVMIKMSQGLGVSCSECHNTRAFKSWTEAPPQRVKALIGAQMVRHLNYQYMLPLNAVLPASRLGPMGDAPKALCATCHNGAYKPLYGYPMAKDYPALWGRTEWNGQPFPAVPTGPAAPADTTAAGLAPAAPTATPGAAAVTPAAVRTVPTTTARTPAPAPAAVAAPAPAGRSERVTGAMGGRGPTGKDTALKVPPSQ